MNCKMMKMEMKITTKNDELDERNMLSKWIDMQISNVVLVLLILLYPSPLVTLVYTSDDIAKM